MFGNYWNKLKLPGKIYFGLAAIQAILITIALVLLYAGIINIAKIKSFSLTFLVIVAVSLIVGLVIAYLIAMLIDWIYGKSKILGWIVLAVLIFFMYGGVIFVVL